MAKRGMATVLGMKTIPGYPSFRRPIIANQEAPETLRPPAVVRQINGCRHTTWPMAMSVPSPFPIIPGAVVVGA